jgi:hypothetical protein
MAIVKQDLVKTQKRYVTLLNFIDDESSTYELGVTGSAFDGIGGITGERFVAGITNNTAALSKITWQIGPGSISLEWAGSPGITAIQLYEDGGEINLERTTLKNNATQPTGILRVSPSTGISGTVLLEFVHASGSVTPPGYLGL